MNFESQCLIFLSFNISSKFTRKTFCLEVFLPLVAMASFGHLFFKVNVKDHRKYTHIINCQVISTLFSCFRYNYLSHFLSLLFPKYHKSIDEFFNGKVFLGFSDFSKS